MQQDFGRGLHVMVVVFLCIRAAPSLLGILLCIRAARTNRLGFCAAVSDGGEEEGLQVRAAHWTAVHAISNAVHHLRRYPPSFQARS